MAAGEKTKGDASAGQLNPILLWMQAPQPLFVGPAASL